MADLLVFDARHLLFRTADAFRSLGVDIDDVYTPTGAIYGFLSVALVVHQRWNGIVVVAWEGENNFRYKLYPDYKHKEPPSEDKKMFIADLNDQEARLRELLVALGVVQYTGRCCEADDVIGTIAARLGDKGHKIVLYSGDSDLRQLVTSHVIVVSPGFRGKNKTYTYGEVMRKDGVEPRQIPDLKALAGDTADNIPGIYGIGPKKAVALVSRYGDVDGVLRAAQYATDWPIPERFKKAILEKADDVRLFKQLTTIKTDVELIRIKPKRNQKKLVELMKIYKFASLLTHTKLRALQKMAG